MTIIQVAKTAVKDGAQLIRYRKGSVLSGVAQYDCKPMFTGSKRGWMAVDSFTASAIVATFKALSPETQAKFNNLPLGKLIPFVWKAVK